MKKRPKIRWPKYENDNPDGKLLREGKIGTKTFPQVMKECEKEADELLKNLRSEWKKRK